MVAEAGTGRPEEKSMSNVVFLDASEIAELDRQHPSSKAKGGWQARLQRIFGRTLGPTLDGRQAKRAA